MTETERKAVYRYVAGVLGRAAHPVELRDAVERIRRDFELAGAQPVTETRPPSSAPAAEVHAGK